VRSFLSLFDKSVQQDHPPFSIDVEKYPRNSILAQVRPNFEKAIGQRFANGHADRPAELNGLDVLPNPFAVFVRRQSLQPCSQRFAASLGPKENGLNSLAQFFGSSRVR
jgi:hypothetical protein